MVLEVMSNTHYLLLFLCNCSGNPKPKIQYYQCYFYVDLFIMLSFTERNVYGEKVALLNKNGVMAPSGSNNVNYVLKLTILHIITSCFIISLCLCKHQAAR